MASTNGSQWGPGGHGNWIHGMAVIPDLESLLAPSQGSVSPLWLPVVPAVPTPRWTDPWQMAPG